MEDQRQSPNEALGALDLVDLVDRHSGILFAYAWRLSGSAVEAEDLVQQTFLRAQQHLAEIRSVETARSWLLSVLRNGYLKGLRRRRPLLAANVGLDLSGVAGGTDDGQKDARFDRDEVQTAINQIPEKFRVVVLMFYFEGCSYQEIAQQLDVPVGTVMSRLSRAKGHLRKRLLNRAPQPAIK